MENNADIEKQQGAPEVTTTQGEAPNREEKAPEGKDNQTRGDKPTDGKQVVEVRNKRGFDDKRSFKRRQKPVSEFEERVVGVKRISKTTKGGRMMRFSALVVIGNKKGVIGYGMGKSNEVPNAIKKAIKNANNNLVNVKINDRGTIYHEVWGHHGASKVLLKPAAEGKGIVAGGPVRAVVELAGFQDIYAKSLGSNTSINMIRATVDGLTKQFTPQEIAKLREKEVEDL